MNDVLFIDFETRSTVDLKARGADVYARDPSTRVMAFAWAFNDEPIQVIGLGEKPPWEVIEFVQMKGSVVAHNAAFEWLIWNYCWSQEFEGLPLLKTENLICTMAMSYAMGLPGSLEKSAAAVGLETQKDLVGQRIMGQLCQPKEIDNRGNPVWYEPEIYDDKFSRLYAYCASDVEIERNLYERLLRLSPQETKLWQIDHKINQRGIRIDTAAAEVALELVELEKKRLDKDLNRVTKGAVSVCTATAQLTDWLKSRGVDCDGIAKKDIAELLSQDLPEDCREALLIRREAAKSSNAKIKSMLNSACGDGRVRSIFQYHGASTGRWAGRRIQAQNFPRPRLSPEEINGVFQLLRRG